METSIRTSRPLLMAFLLLAGTVSVAQVSPQQDDATVQVPDITIIPSIITANGVDFPAHTITVQNTTANQLFRLWRDDITAKSPDVSGRRPTVARGVMIPAVAAEPLTVMAMTDGDRRSGIARLTMAFAQNDSVPLMDNGSQQRHMHELAVRYNQAILKDRIADKKSDLQRAERRSNRATSNEQRVQKRLQRAENRFEQARIRKEREQAARAEIEGDVTGLQRRTAITDSDRDRQRLIRAQRALSRKEDQVLKYMERETRQQAEINKYRQQLPDHDRTLRERSVEVERLEQEITGLQAAHDRLDQLTAPASHDPASPEGRQGYPEYEGPR